MEKMRFEEFINAVVEKIREYLPLSFANASVELNTVTKNNDMKLTGLTIRSGEQNISPTIYLEQFYERYQEGEKMSEVLAKIADLRVSREINEKFDTEQITDFERIKDKIVPKLVNRAWNAEQLKDRVHTDMGDLSVTYHILLQQDFVGNASVAVTNQIMQMWSIDVESLHEMAIKNMRRLTPSTFDPMSKVIASMMDEETAELLAKESPTEEMMFVLSNKSRMNGATAVLDEEIMHTVAKTLGEFIILPSSIHELIIIKGSDDMDTGMLKQMICEVNAGEVAQDERLSDHPYRYSTEDGLVPV